jgi:hypothetical protein
VGGRGGELTRLERYQCLELTTDPLPSVANPFDPSQLDVWGEFTDPRGVVSRVPAFFFQDYDRASVNGHERLTAQDTPVWKLRFTPTRVGRWSWRCTARTASGEVLPGGHGQFVVTESNDPGFLRLSQRDHRYLAHDDGSPYFAIGENVAWYDAGGTFDYDSWFGRLRDQGANYARLWMPTWAFALEAPGSPLGDYTQRLDRAWQLDYVFDLAQQSGLSLMLCLQNHGPFSLVFNSEWAQNPYNDANGGPLAQPQDFFTDPTARDLFRRRTRYCVARWSYAPQLLAWELWNEVDLTGGYDQATVASWHHDMAGYLRSLDPNQHLVTTSLSFYPSLTQSPTDGQIWDTADLDLTQVHRYTTLGDGIVLGDADVSSDLPQWADLMLTRHGRPTLVGEYGVNSQSADITQTLDPTGIAFHDSLWSAALSGAFGTAMTWWWDTYIDATPDVLYPMIGALTRYLADIPWDREGFIPTTASASGGNLAVHGLEGTTVRLLWVKNDNHQWNHPDPSTITGATLDLGTPDDRPWRAEWWDTTSGAVIATDMLPPNGISLPVPPFSGDIALRLMRST